MSGARRNLIGAESAASSNLNTRSSYPASASANAADHAMASARPATKGNERAITTEGSLGARALRDLGVEHLGRQRHVTRVPL